MNNHEAIYESSARLTRNIQKRKDSSSDGNSNSNSNSNSNRNSNRNSNSNRTSNRNSSNSNSNSNSNNLKSSSSRDRHEPKSSTGSPPSTSDPHGGGDQVIPHQQQQPLVAIPSNSHSGDDRPPQMMAPLIKRRPRRVVRSRVWRAPRKEVRRFRDSSKWVQPQRLWPLRPSSADPPTTSTLLLDNSSKNRSILRSDRRNVDYRQVHFPETPLDLVRPPMFEVSSTG